MTNRDLYLLVRNFEKKYSKEKIPTLEKYLTSLWAVASSFSENKPQVEELANWLDLAFTHPAPVFSSAWLNYKFSAVQKGFEYWESRILAQIVDLREMAESGELENEHRYFGIDAPRGSRWYNFDVLTYLECAVRGMYGGYTEEEVIILDSAENVRSVDSEVFQITDFSWEKFAELVEYGQIYE